MTADLGYVDLEESTRARLLKRSIERAELDACSSVVRHAEVYFVPASVRVRERLSKQSELIPFTQGRKQA